MIHLDTGFLVRALVRDSPQDRILREWLGAGEQVGMSAIGWTEFLCGPIEARHADLAMRVVSKRIPFSEEDGVLAARLFNESGRRRGSLTDCMIAATAVRHEAALATTSPRDFRRFDRAGLRLVEDQS